MSTSKSSGRANVQPGVEKNEHANVHNSTLAGTEDARQQNSDEQSRGEEQRQDEAAGEQAARDQQRQATKKGSVPKPGEEVRVIDNDLGVDVPAEVTRVQGPHPDGGHVIDVTTNPDGQERTQVHSVRFMAEADEAREAARVSMTRERAAFPVGADESDAPAGDEETNKR